MEPPPLPQLIRRGNGPIAEIFGGVGDVWRAMRDDRWEGVMAGLGPQLNWDEPQRDIRGQVVEPHVPQPVVPPEEAAAAQEGEEGDQVGRVAGWLRAGWAWLRALVQGQPEARPLGLHLLRRLVGPPPRWRLSATICVLVWFALFLLIFPWILNDMQRVIDSGPADGDEVAWRLIGALPGALVRVFCVTFVSHRPLHRKARRSMASHRTAARPPLHHCEIAPIPAPLVPITRVHRNPPA